MKPEPKPSAQKPELPDPVEYLKGLHIGAEQLRREYEFSLAAIQGKMTAVCVLNGWDSEEANRLTGIQIFAVEQRSQPPSNDSPQP